MLRGFGSREDEHAYQLWREQQLQVQLHDIWALLIQAICVALPTWSACRFAWTSPTPRAGELVLSVVLRASVALLPNVLFLCARGLFVRWRGLIWAQAAVGSGVLTLCVVYRLGTPELWRELGCIVFQRPSAMVLMAHVVLPFVLSLSPWQQLLASLGQACTTHAASSLSSRGAYGWIAHAGFLAASLTISCALEWRMRCQWLTCYTHAGSALLCAGQHPDAARASASKPHAGSSTKAA